MPHSAYAHAVSKSHTSKFPFEKSMWNVPARAALTLEAVTGEIKATSHGTHTECAPHIYHTTSIRAVHTTDRRVCNTFANLHLLCGRERCTVTARECLRAKRSSPQYLGRSKGCNFGTDTDAMALTAAFEVTNASCRPPTVVNNCLYGHNEIRPGSTYN